MQMNFAETELVACVCVAQKNKKKVFSLLKTKFRNNCL
jgi:hypothetical protein